MHETETIIKASNLEMAMLEYFSEPTIEEHHALKILCARTKADREIAEARISHKREGM